MELKEKILSSVDEFRSTPYTFKEIKKYSPIEKENELVFFMKPEILMNEKIKLDIILEIIFDKFSEFDVEIESVSLLGGEYLGKYEIMAKHYGVINKIAKFGKSELSHEAIKKFNEIFGEDINKVEIFGGFQFMEKYGFTPLSLDILWQNNENYKLASGTYCEKIKIGEKHVYLLNGFHPYQLYYFTQSKACIVVMAVASDSDWKDLRKKMIGETTPSEAMEGSIRRILLERMQELNIPIVAQSYNGVHLSAGPVEALAELLRFCSNYETNSELDIGHTTIGKKFLEAFSRETVKKLIENPKIRTDGKTTSVFDITEEVNTTEAIEILKNYFVDEI